MRVRRSCERVRRSCERVRRPCERVRRSCERVRRSCKRLRRSCERVRRSCERLRRPANGPGGRSYGSDGHADGSGGRDFPIRSLSRFIGILTRPAMTMKNLIWKMANPVCRPMVIAHRWTTGFSIYHFPFEIFHLNGQAHLIRSLPLAVLTRSKAPSPLRSAGALQISRLTLVLRAT